MKLCHFNANRLGIVVDSEVADITAVLEDLDLSTWPSISGDILIRNLEYVRNYAEKYSNSMEHLSLDDIHFHSPILSPGKIIGAPVNYQLHLDEAEADREINMGKAIARIHEIGLFLKATSSLVGPGDGITLQFPDRRTDHELELAVVIGHTGYKIPASEALSYVAGYAIGLDITLRGTEERSLRKSIDSYTVVGPWFVTADEIPDPQILDMKLMVNDSLRQKSLTDKMILNVAELIEFASRFYTLYPGDIIFTGTPEGVSPLEPGDVITASISQIGEMIVHVA